MTEKLLLGEPIGNLGGPWWFINMWLNVHMHKRLRFDFFAQQLPWDIVKDYELADNESATRSPLNYGEAIIVLLGTSCNENQVDRFFQTLYDGLSKDQRARMPYEDPEPGFHSSSTLLTMLSTRIMIWWWQSSLREQFQWTALAVGRTSTPPMSFTTHWHWLAKWLLVNCRSNFVMLMW